MKDLINLIFNLPKHTLIQDMSSMEAVGKTYLIIILCIPALAIVSAIIPIICYKNMCKQAIVDQLRESE